MEDGLYVQSLPCELLRRVNIVDTPGTNVILGRQQRLTEEFVPRADLVLFIMSADRPFTDSEVQFLRYIKQWGKKIVFVLNKVDIFDSVDDVDQVRALSPVPLCQCCPSYFWAKATPEFAPLATARGRKSEVEG